MKILDENLFMLLNRIQENDRQFHTRTLDDGTVLVDVPGFGKDDLTTVVDENYLDCLFENDQSTMSFRVGLPKRTENINITVGKGVITIKFDIKPCDISITVE